MPLKDHLFIHVMYIVSCMCTFERFGSGSTRISCIWPDPDPGPDPEPLRFLSSDPDPDPLKKELIWIRVAPKLFRVISKNKCFVLSEKCLF